MATIITIETTVNAPISKVWEYWTEPAHITQWNHASDDWHCPEAINDVTTGGRFSFSMAARDGSASFALSGVYEQVIKEELLAYSISDGRKVTVDFIPRGQATIVQERFEAENIHPVEMQRSGWQNILQNFKRYTESH